MKAPRKIHVGENVVRIEAEALRELAERISGPMAADFERALELMFACSGRVVVTGMGKSGIIARKIAATLSSTGTPSLFMHPAEAMHGDLGMLVRGDVVMALSSSGETEDESLASPLSAGAHLLHNDVRRVFVDLIQRREVNALAMALAEKRGFKEEDFADLHPGGKLGKRLAKVESL